MTTEELLTTIVGVCVDARDHLEQGCDAPEELIASLTGDIIQLIEAHDRGPNPHIDHVHWIMRSEDGDVSLVAADGAGTIITDGPL